MEEKTKQLIAYLAKKHGNASVTVLMKLAYLVDLVGVARLKNQISMFKWLRYNYGPFDKKVYEMIETLVESEILDTKAEYSNMGGEYITYSFRDGADFDFSELEEKDLNIIDEVLESVRGYGAKALTEIAYKTNPMKALGATLGGNQNLGKELNLLA